MAVPSPGRLGGRTVRTESEAFFFLKKTSFFERKAVGTGPKRTRTRDGWDDWYKSTEIPAEIHKVINSARKGVLMGTPSFPVGGTRTRDTQAEPEKNRDRAHPSHISFLPVEDSEEEEFIRIQRIL